MARRDGAIGDLTANNHVHHGHHAQENSQPPKHDAPVRSGGEASCNPPPGEVRSQRDQCQPNEKNGRDRHEDQNPDIRIARPGADAQSHQKAPCASRHRDQRRADDAQQVTRQEG